MDGQRFDRFTIAFARASTRRSALKQATGGLAVFLGFRHQSAAAECRLPGRTCDDESTCCEGHCGEPDGEGTRRCVCPDGLTLCHSACVDTSADPNNCGDCDEACRSESGLMTCEAGRCLELASVECPKCGDCQLCDEDGCRDCDEPCGAEALCKQAAANPDFARLHAELLKRGFQANGDLRAEITATGGTPSGYAEGVSLGYGMREQSATTATLVHVPGQGNERFSFALLVGDGTVDGALAIDRHGAIEEILADDVNVEASQTAIGLRAMPMFAPSPAACAECDERCRRLAEIRGESIGACAVAAGIYCYNSFSDGHQLAMCATASGFICAGIPDRCWAMLCRYVGECPERCDPPCSAPHTMCQDEQCVCRYVTCGETCCDLNLYCKEGQCVPDCGPCWGPRNDGQCFDLCADSLTGQDAGECCIDESTNQGVCCFSREHCCEGVCKDKRRNPKCGEGEDQTCCDEGLSCLPDRHGPMVCCEPEWICNGWCCAGDEQCIGGQCCPALMISPQGGCFA